MTGIGKAIGGCFAKAVMFWMVAAAHCFDTSVSSFEPAYSVAQWVDVLIGKTSGLAVSLNSICLFTERRALLLNWIWPLRNTKRFSR
jgi:hypothetical protein